MLRCVLSSWCEHDRVLELGDNRDSPLYGEATRHYHRCLRPPALHCLWYYPGTLEGPATEGASNGGWQVVFGDEVTEHHFCNSHRFRCINLLRMLKNAFWDKMHAPRACSVAQIVIAQCNWDAMHATRACSVVQFVLAQCTLGCDKRQILRETFHGKDRRRHFEKFTKKLAKIHVNFPPFQIVNIRKDCLVRP